MLSKSEWKRRRDGVVNHKLIMAVAFINSAIRYRKVKVAQVA